MSAYDEFFDTYWSDRSEASARKIVPLIVELVRPASVVDVGCGIGAWLKVFAEFGVEDFAGVDRDYVRRDLLRFDSSRFVVADLTEPLDLGRKYDLAVSLEVGEHLPPEAAPMFVASLTRLAPVILFSAAVPGQGGIDHVNEQWPDYWAAMFRERGYLPLDVVRDRVWNDDEVDWWYRQNTLVYASRVMCERLGPFGADPLRRTVHPQSVVVVGTAALEALRQECDLQTEAAAARLDALEATERERSALLTTLEEREQLIAALTAELDTRTATLETLRQECDL